MTATEAANAAGYMSSKDLGESTRVLDRMCEENGYQTMVIGALKFYPADKLRKHLEAFRAIPDGMVSVSQWCSEHEVRRGRVCEAIREGTYPGTFVYGLREGSKGRPGYYVYPQEVADFAGIEEPKPAEVEWITLDQAKEISGLSKSKLRKLCDRDEVISKYDLHQRVIDAASLDAWLEDQPTEDEPAAASDAPPPSEEKTSTEPKLTDVLKYFEDISKRQIDMHREFVEFVRKPSTVTGTINNLTTRLEAVEEAVKASIQAEGRREASITEILKTFVSKLEETSDEVGGVNDTLDDLEKKLTSLDMAQVKTLIGKVGLMIDSFEKFRSAAITKMQHERAAPTPGPVIVMPRQEPDMHGSQGWDSEREADGIVKG